MHVIHVMSEITQWKKLILKNDFLKKALIKKIIVEEKTLLS
jgi:hypothetical protein